MAVLLFSYYIHRNFPKEFSLSKELAMNLVTGLVINNLIDLTNGLGDVGTTDPCLASALLFTAGVDILRCFCFLIIIYMTTLSSFTYFPLPFTWVFQDFSKFLFEPKCVRVFVRYLNEKEPNKKKVMEKLMKLYIREFDKCRPSTVSNTPLTASPKRIKQLESTDGATSGTFGTIFQNSIKTEGPDIVNRVQFLETMAELEPSFRRFKKTNSFVALFTMLKTFEDITEHAASGW